MKKKLFIAIATGVFMIAMMVNLSVAQKGNAGNLTIGCLAIMSQAQAEDNTTTPCVGSGNGCYDTAWWANHRENSSW